MLSSKLNLLPKHNPYIGYFAWNQNLDDLLNPTFKTVATQTDKTSYEKLGEQIALEYGEGWECLLRGPPAVGK